jgi:hypothetical protein
VQELAPLATWNIPTEQATHDVVVEAPVTTEYSPAGQPKQLGEPVAGWYVPMPQFEHAMAPTPESVPTPQLVQLGDPALAWKRPATHCVHAEEATAPVVARYDPAAQATQLTWPVVPWNVPA